MHGDLQILGQNNQFWKGMVKQMSTKQRAIIFTAITVMILVAAGLLVYSMVQAKTYDGIFVEGVRQVWF